MQRILHGGDYNPEQWLHLPEALAEDLRLMPKAGVNAVSLGIFAWSTLEPREGQYEFAWLDKLMDGLHGAGVGVLLATATAARPQWLAYAHPEVMRTRRDGKRESARTRHNHCWTAPAFNTRAAALIERLAKRYAGHPALRAWHINNEYAGDEDAARCYCEGCIASFQGWLRGRYGSIDALNRAWWTRFWSHDYQDWSQIRPQSYDAVEALELNWRRHHAWQIAESYRGEVAIIRRFSDQPCFTNLHSLPPADYDVRPVAALSDVIGYDSYPMILGQPVDDDRELQRAGFTYDLMRGLRGGKPWWLIESCPGQPQWREAMRAKRPGVHRALSLTAVAHGADAVMYFQWRAGRGGSEKLHGAVVEHVDPAQSRTFNEVATLGAELAGLSAVVGTGRGARVALLYDITCRSATMICSGPGHSPEHRDHLHTALSWYRGLWKRGIAVDVVGPDDALDGYDLILAPHLALLSEATAERFTAAAARGATVAVGPWSGLFDDDMQCWPGGRPGPLAGLLGIRCTEADVLPAAQAVPLAPVPGSPLPEGAHGRAFCELVTVTDLGDASAEVMATYAGEFYHGLPALTRRRHGAGSAWFLAAGLAGDDLAGLLVTLAEGAGIIPLLAAAAPDGVSAQARGPWAVVASVIEGPTSVRLGESGWRLDDGTPAPAELELPPCGTVLLHR